ncbi:MAG: general secretion pathway protein GspK [Candidatus Omnitrophica bacterium]|nr:general secretion pathway protein GspK [Candidatus Omnitrophota bacterium]
MTFQQSSGSSQRSKKAQSGIALIIVVSVLAIAGVMAVSFAFSQRLELKAAANFQLSIKAGYLAEAGVRHVFHLLKEEKGANSYDIDTELWSTVFQGDDVDNDSDGIADSKWFDFVEEGDIVGRYAVLVVDEAGKLNVNTAGFHNDSPLKVTEGWSPFEASIEKLLDTLSVPNAKALTEAALDYRYGGEKGLKGGMDGRDNDLDGLVDETGYPGVDDDTFDDNDNARVLGYDGIDNDADGIRDEPNEGNNEPMEYDPLEPYGDDRVFLTVEQLKGVEGITEEVFQQLRNFAGTHSSDKELTSNLKNRICLNWASADQLYKIFRERGVGEPAMKAVRLKDWLDADTERSSLTKFVKTLPVSNTGAQGDWQWAGDHYVNSVPGGEEGRWRWIGIPEGNYYVSVFGENQGDVVGDVTINGQTVTEMRHGDVFLTSSSNAVSVSSDGSLTVEIRNNRKGDQTECRFRRVELEPQTDGVPPAGFAAIPVQGVEGIRINEIMVKPVLELGVAQGQSPGGDWRFQDGSFINNNPQGGSPGEGTWEWEEIPNGTYYVNVYGVSEGEWVGDVEIKGKKNAHMRSGQRFSDTVTVSGGYVRIEIQNNEEDDQCRFSKIRLSQQPDAEYIELMNVSQDSVSVGGWTVEGPGPEGWPATIPIETDPIPSGGYLVLAVDAEDHQEGISGNGISFHKKNNDWEDVDNAVQLQFENSISETGDLLKDDLSIGTESVRLKNAEGQVVDEVEYVSSEANKSLERASPIEEKDENLNGLHDSFYTTSDPGGGTPGKENRNAALIKEYDEFGQPVYYETAKECWIRSRPVPNLAILAELPLPGWTHWGLKDLGFFVDDITLHAIRLEAEGHQQGISGWTEIQQSAPLTHVFRSQQIEEVGEWKWDKKDRIKNGYYFLRLFGKAGQGFQVSIRLKDGSWTEFTPALTPGSDGSSAYGVIEIGTEGDRSTEKRTLALRLKNTSFSGTATFDYMTLEPFSAVAGKINLNTASAMVLQSLPGVDQLLAEKIIAARPLGDDQGLKRGIGDLIGKGVLVDTNPSDFDLFGKIANLITVRSDTYEVIATGQLVRKGVVLAEKKIRAVVER